MPLQMPASTDPLDRIACFKTSPLLEMMSSLESLSMPWCSPELSDTVERILGPDFRKKLQTVYAPFQRGVSIAELAFSRDDYDDIPGFLEWIGGLSDRDFTWHMMGRIPERNEIPEQIDSSIIAGIVAAWASDKNAQWFLDLNWANHIPEFRADLVDLWRRYWKGVFQADLQRLRDTWNRSIMDKQQQLKDLGGREMYERLSSCKQYPDPLPADMPYKRLEFVPSCRMNHSHAVTFYGWGKVTVLYACSENEENLKASEKLQGALLKEFKSLGDEKRLRIVQQIALNEKVVNGKWLAAKLDLSPSVVSRHLTQLKAADIIVEHTVDNRNYTYSVNMNLIRDLGQTLEAFVLGTTPDQLTSPDR
jgi:DNA-binding transcriptional ArsR family regulator